MREDVFLSSKGKNNLAKNSTFFKIQNFSTKKQTQPLTIAPRFIIAMFCFLILPHSKCERKFILVAEVTKKHGRNQYKTKNAF
jgi:hypothetical protein